LTEGARPERGDQHLVFPLSEPESLVNRRVKPKGERSKRQKSLAEGNSSYGHERTDLDYVETKKDALGVSRGSLINIFSTRLRDWDGRKVSSGRKDPEHVNRGGGK